MLDSELEASLDYTARSCVKKQNKQTSNPKQHSKQKTKQKETTIHSSE